MEPEWWGRYVRSQLAWQGDQGRNNTARSVVWAGNGGQKDLFLFGHTGRSPAGYLRCVTSRIYDLFPLALSPAAYL